MFKRRSDTSVTEVQSTSPNGKGRPTPSRKVAQAERAERVKPPRDTREAKRNERQRIAAERTATRKKAASGDPRFLNSRDRGAERTWIRNFIDSRWSPGELVLPAAILVFLMSLVSPVAYILFYLLVFGVLFDSVVLARLITRGLKENFPDESHRGARMYGILRASQMRFIRIPRPAVKRAPIFRRSPREDPPNA